jgi:hypothetical protein
VGWDERNQLIRQNQTDSEAHTSIGKRPFCLWIGVLAQLKSPLEVIDIARMVPEMDFVMVGWSRDRSIANRLQAEKPANLYYLGTVPDDLKDELIKKCSVGLTTSKYEGFGMVPFEFLSAGKPVLAYPLEVFREVYGDLIIYADSIDEFAQRLRQLCSKRSSATVDADAVARGQARYDLAKAASRIVRRLDAKSLLVFTQDVSTGTDEIAGFYLLEWRLWKLLKESGIDLHIFANGGKFSTQFDLADRTTQVGRIVEHLRCHMKALEQSPKCLDIAKRRIIDLSIRILEPLCYVHRYIAKRKDVPSSAIIASGYSQVLGAIILKYLFGLKLVCLEHDARLYRYDWVRSSLLMKVYYLAYMYVLRHVDLIMLVSDTMRKEFLNYYPHEDRFMVIWNEDTPQTTPNKTSFALTTPA